MWHSYKYEQSEGAKGSPAVPKNCLSSLAQRDTIYSAFNSGPELAVNIFQVYYRYIIQV